MTNSNNLTRTKTVCSHGNGTLTRAISNGEICGRDRDMEGSLLRIINSSDLGVSATIRDVCHSRLVNCGLIFKLGVPRSLHTSRSVGLAISSTAYTTTCSILTSCGGGNTYMVCGCGANRIVYSMDAVTCSPRTPPRVARSGRDRCRNICLSGILSSAFAPNSVFGVIASTTTVRGVPSLCSHA